jgi:hypothetical protein
MKGSLCKLWDRMSLGSYIPHQLLGYVHARSVLASQSMTAITSLIDH